MSRLLVVDDHVMLAEALSARLSTVSEWWIVGQCAVTDRKLSTLVTSARPDLITLDVEPLGSSAAKLIRWIKSERPSAQVVVLTGSHDPSLAVEAARAGASAWVPKELSAERLTGVLRAVCAGHAWFPADLLGCVLRQLREDVRRAGDRNGPLDCLSDRERDVLRGMVAGKRGNRIASELLISAETVRTHTRSILAKLRVHSQLEAVRVACAAGILTGESTGETPQPPATSRSGWW